MRGKAASAASAGTRTLFLRITTLADCFALRHLALHHEIAGGFVEESVIPFQLWWRIDAPALKPGSSKPAPPKGEGWGMAETIGGALWKTILKQFSQEPRSESTSTNDHRAASTVADPVLPKQIGGWETGIPEHQVREIPWERLLQRLILRPDFTRGLASRVVLMTGNRDLLIDAVRCQYRLQQGTVTWTQKPGDEKGWLIRIDQPSRWVIDRLPLGPDDRLYNLVPLQEQVYLEAGYSLEDVRNAGAFGRFRFWENQHLFIDHTGVIQVANPVWKPAVDLVHLKFGEVETWETRPAEAIEVPLRLRPVEERQRPALWHVCDIARLRGLLQVIGFDRLAGFFIWFGEEDAWVLSRHAQVDQSLVTGLSEAFPAFHPYRERVFLPLGMIVSPMLPEARLFEAFGAVAGDLLVIGHSEATMAIAAVASSESVEAVLPGGCRLPEAGLKPLSSIVRYLAQRALAACGAQDERFRFSFPAPRKRAVEVAVDLPGRRASGHRKASHPGEAAEESRSSRDRQATPDQASHPGDGTSAGADDELAQAHLTLARIREIDRALLEDIAQPELWRERGRLGRRMEDRVPSLVSELTAEVLSGDPAGFLGRLLEGAGRGPVGEVDPAPLLAPTPGEQEKGRFLAAIRRETVPAELWYAWNLAYGARFKDADIFSRGLEAMRSGFCDDQRRFFDFAERSFERGSSPNAAAIADPAAASVQTMGFERMSEIAANLARFFGVVDRREPAASRLLRLQMRKILRSQCPLLTAPNVLFTQELLTRCDEMWVDQLLPGAAIPPAPGPSEASPEWEQVFAHLRRFEGFEPLPRSPQILKTWKELLERPLAQCSLVDLFTGELYRSVFAQGFHPGDEARKIGAAWRNRQEDWGKSFTEKPRKGELIWRAKRQKILLHLVTSFAPSGEFKPFIRQPLEGDLVKDGGTVLHGIVLNADGYRLMQVYRMPVDDDAFFPTLIGHLPMDDGEFLDFRDAAEQIIFCLFISTSPRRQEWLDQLLERSLAWWPRMRGREDLAIELMCLISYLQLGLLLDLIPETLSRHHFQSRRRSLWIDHAAVWSRDPDGFSRWQEAWKAASAEKEGSLP